MRAFHGSASTRSRSTSRFRSSSIFRIRSATTDAAQERWASKTKFNAPARNANDAGVSHLRWGVARSALTYVTGIAAVLVACNPPDVRIGGDEPREQRLRDREDGPGVLPGPDLECSGHVHAVWRRHPRRHSTRRRLVVPSERD